MTSDARLATYFHLHLVSDSTGETLYAMSRAACARFNDVLEIEHIYSLVRSPPQVERVLQEIAEAPGVILHTIVDERLRGALETGCQKLEMPCFGALDPLVSALSWYLGAPLSTRVGAQYSLDTDYFNRIDALSYALGHDDGQGGQDLQAADVVLVGVSRTSKTPTSIYLAHRGVKAANVPIISPDATPQALKTLAGVPIVGLTVSPDRLVQIRRNRLRSISEGRDSAYVDIDLVRAEIVAARRMFEREGWPVIDVTRRSVEETAAAVINILSGGHGQVEIFGVSPIVLASSSLTRAKVLAGAGVLFTIQAGELDEAPLKRLWLSRGEGAQAIAGRLAEAKALATTASSDTLVIGGDQTLELDGMLLDKTATPLDTRERLVALRGRNFALHSAVAGASAGKIDWRHTESAHLSMRHFSDDFLDGYLARNAVALASSLAGFALEEEGAQLFDRVEGDYFAILGLPLIPLLGWLRARGGLET